MPDEPKTTVGAVARLGDTLITALPPAFLMLVVMNMVFLGTILWFESRQSEQRLKILEMAFEACPSLLKTDRNP